MNLRSKYKGTHFCILFSITGRTALIQSSWLHAPGEKHETGINKTADVCAVPKSTVRHHKTDSFRGNGAVANKTEISCAQQDLTLTDFKHKELTNYYFFLLTQVNWPFPKSIQLV